MERRIIQQLQNIKVEKKISREELCENVAKLVEAVRSIPKIMH